MLLVKLAVIANQVQYIEFFSEIWLKTPKFCCDCDKYYLFK